MNTTIFIIDTNVLVAGLITSQPNSPTAQILDAMLGGSIFFLLSADLLREYRGVLLRPRLTRAHRLNKEEVDHILSEIAANAIWREPQTDRSNHLPDPHDAHLGVLLAEDPKAILITGDQLLIKNTGSRFSVISPSTWAEQFVGH
jgi:putative PIN family toxin of toxin-antitoxin system